MSEIEAIFLGVIQGLTEFLPVSSSGHLELAKDLYPGNIPDPESSMLFTVLVHFATALSTIVIFRKEVAEILKGLLQFKNNDAFRFSIKIIISMIPAAAAGIIFQEEIEYFFTGNILLVGFMLIVTGLLLFLADKARKTEKNVSFGNAFIIGISQMIAILPGISRSGATISTSVLLGIDREKAARFSFLMVVPLIFGKIAKDIKDGALQDSTIGTASLTLGFIAAFVIGLLACQLMISLVKKSQLKYFSYYCFLVGIAAIVKSAL